MMVQATHKERAGRSWRQTSGIHAHSGSSSAFSASAAQPTHGLPDRLVDDGIVQPLQKTIPGREIGHAREAEPLTQFAMFAQPHLGLAKGPVLLPHPAENRQQLGLVELMLAESAAVERKHRLGNFQSDANEGQESDFGHRTSCRGSKQQFQTAG
jgi:hypothetical protein